MKIIKGTLTSLARQGYITLQVPSVAIGPYELEEVPDEWLMTVKSGRLTAGREWGFTFLSPTGWAQNKDAIKAAFEVSASHRGSWSDFEDHATKFFAEVEKKTNVHAKNLQKKLDDARKSLNVFKVAK